MITVFLADPRKAKLATTAALVTASATMFVEVEIFDGFSGGYDDDGEYYKSNRVKDMLVKQLKREFASADLKGRKLTVTVKTKDDSEQSMEGAERDVMAALERLADEWTPFEYTIYGTQGRSPKVNVAVGTAGPKIDPLDIGDWEDPRLKRKQPKDFKSAIKQLDEIAQDLMQLGKSTNDRDFQKKALLLRQFGKALQKNDLGGATQLVRKLGESSHFVPDILFDYLDGRT